MNQESVAQVISLCRAVRDAITMLELTGQQQTKLLEHVARAERAVTSDPPDPATAKSQVLAIRYLLVEVADGPMSAFMADAAAQIIGDGIGRLFS